MLYCINGNCITFTLLVCHIYSFYVYFFFRASPNETSLNNIYADMQHMKVQKVQHQEAVISLHFSRMDCPKNPSTSILQSKSQNRCMRRQGSVTKWRHTHHPLEHPHPQTADHLRQHQRILPDLLRPLCHQHHRSQIREVELHSRDFRTDFLVRHLEWSVIHPWAYPDLAEFQFHWAVSLLFSFHPECLHSCPTISSFPECRIRSNDFPDPEILLQSTQLWPDFNHRTRCSIRWSQFLLFHISLMPTVASVQVQWEVFWMRRALNRRSFDSLHRWGCSKMNLSLKDTWGLGKHIFRLSFLSNCRRIYVLNLGRARGKVIFWVIFWVF